MKRLTHYGQLVFGSHGMTSFVTNSATSIETLVIFGVPKQSIVRQSASFRMTMFVVTD